MGLEGHRHEAAVKRYAVIAALLAGPAAAQPAGDTTKFQPTILNLRACIRANAPPAYLAEVRTHNDAFRYFLDRCYQPFSSDLATLGASDAATGSFRLIVGEEWSAFLMHVRSR